MPWVGDSMIEDLITEGDVVIMRPVPEPDQLKNGTIVAARVEGHGTTLKLSTAIALRLKPANSKYKPIEVAAMQVQVQGALIGVGATTTMIILSALGVRSITTKT